jgi:diketogulonate reductase-like aldo/keto reductase
MTRERFLKQLLAMGITTPSLVAMIQSIRTRPIPSTDEQLPVIGVGTWRTFDVGSAASERDPLKEVLKTLITNGGKVIDSSPMYGQSEKVVGELSDELKLNSSLFMATKVWTTGKEEGIRQMNQSFALMKRKQMDLMQIHNLVDWRTHLATLREWKEQNKVRYIGITHYSEAAYASIEEIINTNQIDFLQINYSLASRKSGERLLPLAKDKNMAVIINRPFEEGALLQQVKGKQLPEWAKEFDCVSWAQFFLKYIISNPAVTCAIPGTDKPRYMIDNLGAAVGKLPDHNQRAKMVNMIDNL